MISLTRHQRRLDPSLPWRSALVISIPAICLFVSILAIALLHSKTLAIRQQERQSQQTTLEMERCLKALMEAETSVRGYAIAKRPEFLKPYLQAKTILPQCLDSLNASLYVHPSRRDQFASILSLVRRQVQLLEQTLQASNLQNTTPEASPVITERLVESESNLNKLRQEISQFYAQEKSWQRHVSAKVAWWTRLITLVQWSALGIGFMSSGAAFYLFNQLDRERREQASRLRESNIYLQAVFDNVVDGILILDAQGYIQSANTAACEIFGYELDEIPGKHLQRLIAVSFTDDSGKVMSDLVGTQQDKLCLQQETQGRQKTGKTFPMEFAISEMQLDNQYLYIAIVRDITERKQSQEILLKQAQLLNLANDTIIVRDLNDIITYWNQGAQRLYSFSSAQAVGQSIHALLKTEFPQPLEEIEAIVFQQGYWSGELIHSRRDSTRVAVKSGWTLYSDETGEPEAYLEINQDISDQKLAESALRQSEERYRTLVKNFPNGAVFLFDDQMRFTVAEGTGLAEVNLDSQALTGKTIWETLPPDTVQILEPIYREALQGKSNVMEMPLGNRLYYVYVLPVINEDGEILSGMAMTQDITKNKRAEEVLRSRADELAQLTTVLAQTTANLEKRNADLDQFAYIVSHDLKAPLRAIANLSQWLEEDLEEHLTEDTQHQMNLLRGRVHRMEALINGLLQYSRVGRVRTDLERVDVEQLLAEVIDSLAPPPEFAVAIMPGMPTLWTERLPLEQVFANLIGNAIKHNPREDGQVAIAANEQTDCYEFTITDNGPGIPPEFHEKVFVMFQTLQPRDKVESTGVGLAIVKKIIEDKGGTISLESARSQGATFRFTWPKLPMG
jgi:PAS domain S-box-containing protein